MTKPVVVDVKALLARVKRKGPDTMLSISDAVALIASRTPRWALAATLSKPNIAFKATMHADHTSRVDEECATQLRSYRVIPPGCQVPPATNHCPPEPSQIPLNTEKRKVARPVAVDVQMILARVKREGPDALLSMTEATALIASRTTQPWDYPRGAKKRVRIQLDRAIHAKAGSRREKLATAPGGQITMDELSHWAKKKYPQKFDDLPSKPRGGTGVCRMDIPLRVRGFACELPASLPKSHALILSLYERLQELEQLRPEAEAFRQSVAEKAVLTKKLSDAGKKGGRPPKVQTNRKKPS